MKTIIRISGKRISRKKAEEMFGKERIKRRIYDAKKEYQNDPLTLKLNEWMDGMTISFEQ